MANPLEELTQREVNPIPLEIIQDIQGFLKSKNLILCVRQSCCQCPVFSPYIYDRFGRETPKLVCYNEICKQCFTSKCNNNRRYCSTSCELSAAANKTDEFY